MLQKIDCVMVRWTTWTRPDTDAEIVLHTMDLPREWNVYYLVDDVLAAVSAWRGESQVIREPFEIVIGWCAVLADPFGNAVGILDMTKGPRGPLGN